MRPLRHRQDPSSPENLSPQRYKSGSSDLLKVMEYNTERGIEADQQRSTWQQRSSEHQPRETSASSTHPPYSNQHQQHQQQQQQQQSSQHPYSRESHPPSTMPPTAAGPMYHQHPQHSHTMHQGESTYFSVPPGAGGAPHSQQQYSAGHPNNTHVPAGPHSQQSQAAGHYSHAAGYPTQQQQHQQEHHQQQQQQANLYSAEAQGPPPPTLPQQQQQQQGLSYTHQGNRMMDGGSLHPPPPNNPYNNHNHTDMSHPTTFSQQSQQHLMRPAEERPIVKVTVDLLETYKTINERYYQERERRRQIAEAQQLQRTVEEAVQPDEQLQQQQQQHASAAATFERGPGVHNNGYDDTDYDYILTQGELFNNRYRILERIGKGSFGQVVSATDIITNTNVAIKIIKSKKPFQVQAKTEIELLIHLRERDRGDQHNIVRLLSHFMYRNHQCLVFEMLSMNLYDLLKNTKFTGVSLNLIRKFAKQILKALQFLSQPDVDVIHCDLKPENILLRHPKRSGVKVIDFGSSCKSNKRMYIYIQSRFYRSPEVILGLPYSVSIDMWSLGCILVEMHTGEPLFSGSDQVDQMQKIVKVLGMIPDDMLNQVDEKHKVKFFERPSILSREWVIKRKEKQQERIIPSSDPIASLKDILQTEARKKKVNEKGGPPVNYDMFVDLIQRMLTYDPLERISPDEAMQHPFIVASEHSLSRQASNGTSAVSSRRY